LAEHARAHVGFVGLGLMGSRIVKRLLAACSQVTGHNRTRAKAELKKSEIGALLCFDMNNIRYITNTTLGTWAIDKLGRFCLQRVN